jgi:hypothetical protein
MELNRMKGEVSEELRRSFEGWTMTTRLRQHASADCFYRPDGRRTRILAALPREFTYADLKRVIKSHGGSKVDERIMATHLNHQTILAVGQRRVPDRRLRFGPPPAVTPSKRRRTDAPEPDAGPPVDVSEQELDAARAKAAALNAAAAQAVAAAAQAVADLAQADADLATKKRQRRETIDRQIERLKAARDALESDVYVQPQPPPPPPLQQPPAPPPLAPPPAPGPYYVL